MFDSHHHHTTTVPADVIDRIEKQMCDTAAKTASNVAEQVVKQHEFRNQATREPAKEAIFTSGYAGCAVEAMPAPAPRLEPYYGEVKLEMERAKVSEKVAEKNIRKQLLYDAAYCIKDSTVREFVRATLVLI